MFTRTLGILARGLLLSTALTQSAWPITPDQRAVVMGKIKPVWQWNALSLALPADGSVTDTSPSLGGLVLAQQRNTDGSLTGGTVLTTAGNNQITQSNTFSKAGNWASTVLPVTITDNAATEPGGNPAALFAETMDNLSHGVYSLSNQNIVAGSKYIASVKFKKGNGATAPKWMQIAFRTTGFLIQPYANFDIESGTTPNAYNGAVAYSKDLGGGWYLCSVLAQADTSATANTGLAILFNGNSGTASRIPVYAGATTANVFVSSATFSTVTYETTLAQRPGDQVVTTDSAYYGPKFDYGQGLRVWEQRQNVIRNNTMQGAVAGVAHTTGSISSISRSGSTTVVVAATGHNVAVGDMITVSGATPSAYNGTYAVSAISANVSYSYVCASSATDTASGATVAAVSRGTVPTGWSLSSLGVGLTTSVSGVGTDNGLPYFDVRIAGLATGTAYPTFGIFGSNTDVPATAGQVYTISLYTKLIAGSYTNLAKNPYLSTQLFDASQSYLGSVDGPATTPSGSLQRISAALTLTNGTGTTAYAKSLYMLAANAGVIDITLRLAAPQMEQAAYASPPILTYGSAVTASADSVVISDLSKIGGFNASAGAFGVEFGGSPTVNQLGRIAEFNSTGYQNMTSVVKENSDDSGPGSYLNITQYAGSETVLNLSNTAGNDGANHRVVTTWGGGKLSGSLDGQAPVVGTQLSPSPTKFDIGSRTDSGLYYCNCYIRGLAFYPPRPLQPSVQQNKSRVGAQW